MATIIVRYKNNRFRMWNTVVDMWASPICNRTKMIEHVMGYLKDREGSANYMEAVNWVDRKGYKKEHLRHLNKWYDSKVRSLSQTSRRNSEAWKK